MLNRLLDWVSLGGAGLMAVAAVFAGIMARRAGEGVWVSVLAFATAAVCVGYLVFAWRTRASVAARRDAQSAADDRYLQLADEAQRYDLDALAAFAAALTDDDPEVSIEVGTEPTSYRIGPDQAMVGLYSYWHALLNSLGEHGHIVDWDWDEPPDEVFDWFCEVVDRRWPGVDLRRLAANQGHLGVWTSHAYDRDRDDASIDSPATLDGYLAPFGIRVGWFENGQAMTMFVVSQRGFDRIAALQRDFGLARPVSILGVEQRMFRRTRRRI